MKRIVIVITALVLLSTSQLVLASDMNHEPVKLLTIYESGELKLSVNDPQPESYFEVRAGDKGSPLKIDIDLVLNAGDRLMVLSGLDRLKIRSFSPERGVIGEQKEKGLALSNTEGTVYLEVEGFVPGRNKSLVLAIVDENNYSILVEVRSKGGSWWNKLFDFFNKIKLWFLLGVVLIPLAWLLWKKKSTKNDKASDW